MKLTTSWLKEHLDTRLNENQIIDKLTEIGLEVENLENQPSKQDTFLVAKILRTEKHPNADRLKVCDVDIWTKKLCESCLWCTKCKKRFINNLCATRINNS